MISFPGNPEIALSDCIREIREDEPTIICGFIVPLPAHCGFSTDSSLVTLEHAEDDNSVLSSQVPDVLYHVRNDAVLFDYIEDVGTDNHIRGLLPEFGENGFVMFSGAPVGVIDIYHDILGCHIILGKVVSAPAVIQDPISCMEQRCIAFVGIGCTDLSD